MKAVFVQSYLRYDKNEFRAAQYHGAIFAEEFCKNGHLAWKMVDGNPEVDIPISPLLLVSSQQQRISPDYWAEQKFDLIVVYGGHDLSFYPMYQAIKKGLPNCLLVLKTDAVHGMVEVSIKNILKTFTTYYVRIRNGGAKFLKWNGFDGTYKIPIIPSIVFAIGKCVKSFLKHERKLLPLIDLVDYVSYENKYAIVETQDWLRRQKRKDLVDKIVWLGYPVRDSFALSIEGIIRQSNSIISVANWKHAKDIKLHAEAISLVFQKNQQSTLTIIGNNSDKLYDLIKRISPLHIHRVKVIKEIQNSELGKYLQCSQVFMACSIIEGICSTPIEAMSSGCSCALSSGCGVPCFSEFVQNNCGTQAKSRRPIDMAEAVLKELSLWQNGLRNSDTIKKEWSRTLVSNGYEILMGLFNKKKLLQ